MPGWGENRYEEVKMSKSMMLLKKLKEFSMTRMREQEEKKGVDESKTMHGSVTIETAVQIITKNWEVTEGFHTVIVNY